jgi:hypothetical protein
MKLFDFLSSKISMTLDDGTKSLDHDLEILEFTLC